MINASILIDGSNFYFKLRDLNKHQLENFDFTKFLQKLINEDNLNKVLKYFYIGAVRTNATKSSKLKHANQQRLFKHLINHGFEYKLGYLLITNGKTSEKGVDVNIAVDMLIQGYEKIVKTIYLVSSDTDLIPAISQVRKLGIEVVYVGFKHKPSRALINKSSRVLLIDENLLKDVVKTK